MSRWEAVSEKTKRNLFHLPDEVIQSPNYHFYTKDGLQMDRFQLLAFIFSDTHRQHLLLRFWQLEDDLLYPGVKLLDEVYSGNIFQEPSLLVHMLELLRGYGQELEHLEDESIFHLIAVEQYETLQIQPAALEPGTALYQLIGEPEFTETGKNKFLYLSKDDGKRDVGHFAPFFTGRGVNITHYMKIVEIPQKVKYPPEFWDCWNNPKGGLRLTRSNVEQFCLILEKHFGLS